MKIEPSILPSLAWFALIVRAGSFSRAASEMGITRAALSQNLKSLEERLNTKLIYRTTRNMSLTEEGQRLYDVLVSAFGQIDDALKDVGDTQLEPTGLLRINSSRVAARMLVEPHICEFLTRYPKTKIELIMDDGLSNIIAEGCDAGIRPGQGLDEHMTAVPVSPLIKLITVASPDYLRKYGIPETPYELSNHNCLRLRHKTSGALSPWEFSHISGNNEKFEIEASGRYIANDDESMIRMAINGAGIIQHLDFAIAEQIDAGKLQPILQDWSVSFPGFYIYVSSRVRMPSKVRAFIDFMVEKRLSLKSNS
ncbi:LysR family transcriptional regulator [Escherichia albertii]|uniref:LysR family transcriptional regulator n=1 Tax=Escherichia albertii TaxID=208962 RepID=UPI002360DC48|nr:LysR family transcriptional regulator [Escherichia albertii]WDC22266.1 LysR family transcriptional regulator [Escherichia albertii]